MRTASSRRVWGHGAAAGVVAGAAGAAWGQFNEQFDDWVPAGWRAINRSQFASGSQGWEQAFSSPFFAYSEPAFAASSPAANTQTGIISTWLTSPPVSLHNGDTLDFWVKSLGENPDRMQVRMSTAGTNGNPGSTPTSVGVFTTLLLDINPTYTATGFPTEWTHYTLNVSGLSAPATGMFAFRYFIEPEGTHGPRGSYVGIDDVRHTPLLPGTGACCKSDGSCVTVTPTECAYQNGVYQGDGLACGQIGCPSPSPCCLPDTNCVQAAYPQCTAAGGNTYGCGNACPVLGCFNATGLSIPVFNGSPGAPGPDAVATVTIPPMGGRLIDGGLSIGIDVQSAWQGVYRARVVHPDGTSVQLILLPGVSLPKVVVGTNYGFSNQNFGGGGSMMSFVDGAPAGVYDNSQGFPGPPRGTATGTDNVAGTWRPYAGTLSQFNGKRLAGTWKLIVNDDGSGAVGHIRGFRVCAPHHCYMNLIPETTMPCLNVGDFAAFLNLYAIGDPRANCDESTTPPVLNVLDFSCFLNWFSSCTAC